MKAQYFTTKKSYYNRRDYSKSLDYYVAID